MIAQIKTIISDLFVPPTPNLMESKKINTLLVNWIIAKAIPILSPCAKSVVTKSRLIIKKIVLVVLCGLNSPINIDLIAITGLINPKIDEIIKQIFLRSIFVN